MSTEKQRLFWVWWEAKERCGDPRNKHFVNYGGRGITMCDRWQSFKAFMEDMGPRPEGGMIERIDNDRGYAPENCKWATRKEQNSNRRNCIFVTLAGERMTLKEACRRKGLVYRAVHKRIVDRGWDVAIALNTPVERGLRYERLRRISENSRMA